MTAQQSLEGKKGLIVSIANIESCAKAMHLSGAELAEPLMPNGGCLLTMSYFGAEEVVPHYSIMGPVKAALESTARYLAAELGPRGIRVHPISCGPIRTRAASGNAEFNDLLSHTLSHAPLRRLVSIDDVGALAVFLVSDAAAAITGCTMYVDAGCHIVH